MSSKVKRPKPRAVGPVRVRVVRGPREDGRWYWKGVRSEAGAELVVWTGWATGPEADQAVAGLVAAGKASPREPDRADTVRDLLELWLGRQAERADLSPHTVAGQTGASRQVVASIGDVRVERLDRATLEGHRDRRLRAGGASSTIRQELIAISAAWRWGRERELVPDRDLPAVRITVRPSPTRNHYTPTPGEVAAMVHASTGWARVAIWLLAAAGCRLGEVERLRWSDLDLEEGLLHIRGGKTGARTIPLAPPIVVELRAWRQERGAAEHVWPVSRQSWRSQLRRAMTRACAAAGIPACSPHGLRRAAVDTLYRSGADIGAAAAALGHSPSTALRAYRSATIGDLRAALKVSRLGYLAEPGQVIELRNRNS